MICRYLWKKGVGCHDTSLGLVMYLALTHDLLEVYTGDIPTPAKKRGKKKESVCSTVDHADNLVKLADILESYHFIYHHIKDTPQVEQWVLDGIRDSLGEQLEVMGIQLEEVMELLP